MQINYAMDLEINIGIFLKLCHICMNQMMIYGMLARSKLSPFENTRPCVARHVNNKIENMIPFFIMTMIVTRRL
jgi:hypothetical protein